MNIIIIFLIIFSPPLSKMNPKKIIHPHLASFSFLTMPKGNCWDQLDQMQEQHLWMNRDTPQTAKRLLTCPTTPLSTRTTAATWLPSLFGKQPPEFFSQPPRKRTLNGPSKAFNRPPPTLCGPCRTFPGPSPVKALSLTDSFDQLGSLRVHVLRSTTQFVRQWTILVFRMAERSEHWWQL